MTKPNFFILGAPKCGTTALAQWLGEHPNIYMSPVKEPHYYSTDIGGERGRLTGLEYEKLFDKVGAHHKAIGEASTWYLFSRYAVTSILSEIPNAKFIVCIRNPVDMAYSLHWQHLNDAHEHIKDFREAWYAQSQRAAGRNVRITCADPQFLLYGPACLLGRQMTQLLDAVPKNRIQTIVHDDMKNNPCQCYMQVLRFLGLSSDERDEFPVINPASQRRYPRIHAAVKTMVLTGRRLGIPRLGTGFTRWLGKWNTVPKAYSPMSKQTREQLQDYFAEDVKLLGDLLGRDLSRWTNDAGEGRTSGNPNA